MLRLEIDGRWEPEDFINVMKGVEAIYYKAATSSEFPFEQPFYVFDRPFRASSFEEHLEKSNDWFLAWVRKIAEPHIRLSVVRIEYASPGSIDLVGFGAASKAVAEVIVSFITFFSERELRRQRDEQAKLETAIKRVALEKEQESLSSLKLENARAVLAMRRDYPEAQDELLLALVVHDQEKLIPLITERKIVGANVIEGGVTQSDRET